jgi:hypothetical protein
MATSKAKVQELLGDLKKVIERLSPDNAGMALTSFIQISEIFRLRQLRLGKTVLNRSMVRRAWELLAYHQEKCFTFRCEGALAVNMGDIAEGEAVDYYGKHVVGKVQDAYGRTVSIADGELVHMYKDRDERHTMESEFYQPTRGKRLPWIRHVIEKTPAVYVTSDPAPSGERRLIYTARAILPHPAGETTTYFVVIVRRDRNGNLHFVTAYPIFEELAFLAIIEKCDPYQK